MASPQQMALQNFGILIPELAHGTLNTARTAILATDITPDGNRFRPTQNWAKHRSEGTRGTVNALDRDSGTLASTYEPQYGLMDMRARQVFGQAYAAGTLTDGSARPYSRYRLPERGAAQDVETATLYYGVEASAYQLLQCFIKDFGISSARTGAVSGTLTYGEARVNRNVAMPNAIAATAVQRLYAVAAAGAVTVNHALGGAGSFTVTPGDAAAAVQTAARSGGITGVTVTGASAVATAGTAEVESVTLSTVAAGPVVIQATPLVGAMQTVSFQAQSPTAAADFQAALEGVYGAGKVAVSGSLTGSSGGGFSGVLTVTFSATLGNVTQLTSNTTGVTTATTTQGVASTTASVNFLFTFAGQANTNVATMTVSGANASGYTVSIVTQGADGTGFINVNTAYLETNHSLKYRAASLADLLSIDMTNRPSDGSAGDSHLILSCESGGFNIAGIADVYYAEDGRLFPGSYTVMEGDVTCDLTLAKSSSGDCELLYASEQGCTATQLYLRYAWKCGDWEVWLDAWVSRDAAPQPAVGQNVSQEKFTFSRAPNQGAYAAGYGSCVMTVIRPVGTIAV